MWGSHYVYASRLDLAPYDACAPAKSRSLPLSRCATKITNRPAVGMGRHWHR